MTDFSRSGELLTSFKTRGCEATVLDTAGPEKHAASSAKFSSTSDATVHPSWSLVSTPFPVRWAIHEVKSATPGATIISTDWEDAVLAKHARSTATVDYLESPNSTNHTIARVYSNVNTVANLLIVKLPVSMAKYVKQDQSIAIALMFSYKKRGEGEMHGIDSHDLDAEVRHWYGLGSVESNKVFGAYERVGVVKGSYAGYFTLKYSAWGLNPGRDVQTECGAVG
ncbi:hypothetical protein B0H66DRAFT_537762 [Apodospora peruviana]|uniref:Uncharacterized protein n=1 Tax=Apodospora peruviana TaxID=516989 RepID=A0AAE0LYT7_9PEZI|nr:hypothetical protein B0H66DRAFT_537762 [Apodospora peruviana]